MSESRRPLRSRAFTWALIVAIVGFLAWGQTGGAGGPAVGGPAPEFTVRTLAGQTFDLGEHRGRVVVLDFWASWCPPCIKTLPALQRVHEKFAADDDVVVASVNTDQGKNRERQVELFMKNHRYDFPVLLDDAQLTVQQAYRVRSIPTMVVLDGEGVVRRVQVGVHASNVDRIAEAIEAMIEEVRPSG